MSGFTVTDEAISTQLTTGSRMSLGHLLWNDDNVWVLSAQGAMTPKQAAWYLKSGDWLEDNGIYQLCEEGECLKAEHLTDSKAEADGAEDTRILDLVERASTTLASLYRRGLKMGYITPTTAYS